MRDQRGDEELVLRFFAVKNYIDGFKGNVEDWLDDYMEEVLFERVPFRYEREERIFIKVFDFIADKFDDAAFSRRKNNSPVGRLAPAYFEAVVGAVHDLVDDLQEVTSRRLIRALDRVFESDEFKENTGPGANKIYKLKGRIENIRTELQRLI